jgi:Na+-transporting NADH:ubiquinone oxidoreductase subunit B
MFGIFIGKEIFGGTGMNIWNPALTSRAFLYFAYPAQIIGDNVWVAAQTNADGYSGATWLAVAKEHGLPGVTNGVPEMTNAGELGVRNISWWEAFLGLQPGSIGETSELMVLLGAVVLLVTRVGSWRIMVGSVVGTFLCAVTFNVLSNDPDSYFNFPFYWHWVVGAYAFSAVFFMTDPVSAPYTHKGRFIYGFLIGVLGITIRVVNPAFAGSWMLAILFMNMFSPLIDHFVVQANVKRRRARYATA